jgi:hypothetical protein
MPFVKMSDMKTPHSKMSCKEARRWISARLDGIDPPAGAAGALDEHLSACEGCLRVSSLMKRDAALLASALRVDEGLQSELSRSILRQAALAEAPGSVPGARRAAFLGSRLRWGIAAAFLLAAGTLVLVGRKGPSVPGTQDLENDGSYPVSIMLEEERHSLAPFPGAREAGVGLETRKVRRILVDSQGRPYAQVKAEGGLDDDSIKIEEERVDSRLIQPVGWTYH